MESYFISSNPLGTQVLTQNPIAFGSALQSRRQQKNGEPFSLPLVKVLPRG
jgi:hypothetical protein